MNTQESYSKQAVLPSYTVCRWNYAMRYRGVVERSLTIQTAKGGDKLELCLMTDLHINHCNEEDLLDPVLASTHEHRLAFDQRLVLPNIENSFHYAEGADRIVILGDIYDYLSKGVIELTEQYVFSHKNVIACTGNHEFLRQMQGTVPETLSLEERRAAVAKQWCNDSVYHSEVLGGKVMLILLDNGLGFLEPQIEKLRCDLERARTEALAVLLFYHVPLNTGKEEDRALKALWANDPKQWNFCNSPEYAGPDSKGVNGEIYRLITSNADVIAATFCGHVHSDFYSEIPATTPDGTKTVIPQYMLTGAAYNQGHIARITVC